MNLKVCDFGFVCRYSVNGERIPLIDRKGTECYMAPEILNGEAYYGDKADIFTMGVVLFMMIFANKPFK